MWYRLALLVGLAICLSWALNCKLCLAGLCQSGGFEIDGHKMDGSNVPRTDNPKTPGEVPAQKARTMLYGRIEEITGRRGAKLPVELHALVPKMDTSGQEVTVKGGLQANTLKAQAAFPRDWRGSWAGTLKVFTTEFTPLSYQIDAEEAKKESDLLRPGVSGEVGFEFNDNAGALKLEPAQVVFTAPGSKSNYSDMIGQMLGDAGANIDNQTRDAVNGMFANIPMIFALHLGNLDQGLGVTGNLLQSRVVKNDVKQLQSGAIEQEVITYDADRNQKTGKTRYTYTESVLRFYRQSGSQLYVQAAIVSYLSNGQFVDKVVMYGTVNRGQPRSMNDIINSSLFKGLIPQ